MSDAELATMKALEVAITSELTQLFEDSKYPAKIYVLIYDLEADIDEDVANIYCGEDFYYRWDSDDETSLYISRLYDGDEIEIIRNIYVDIDDPDINLEIRKDLHPFLPKIKAILDKYLMK